MAELVAYGTYVPYWRIDRSTIADALQAGDRSGARAVASYDEDATSMAVEAARVALSAAPSSWSPQAVVFSTTTPPYLDKTNASALQAAVALSDATGAYDFTGAPRSALGALRFARAAQIPSLVAIAEIRTGLVGSADESQGGDGAAALAFGDGPGLVSLLGEAARSAEFLDRWRAPGDVASKVWEERFAEGIYKALATQAFEAALHAAHLERAGIDYVIVAGLHARAVRAVTSTLGVDVSRLVPDWTKEIGNTGAAHSSLLLASVLDRAAPDEVIAVVDLADGADVSIYRCTNELVTYRARQRETVGEQVSTGRHGLSYASFLTWRNMLDREPPRRPDPDSPAAPPSHRNEAWKFSLVASRCTGCGTRHLPPARVCLHCHAVDTMANERLADVLATIATYTIDRLAYSPSPPLISAIVDFDGGGRMLVEVTDADPSEVAIGGRVRMTFRRLYTSTTGVHDYFWKAQLVREGGV